MQADFDVVAVPEKNLIRLTMSGFFSKDDIDKMRNRLVCALAELGCGPNQHDTLCDIRGMKIQAQQSVSLFQDLVGSDPVRSRLLAFVVGPTLARLQARRLTDREGVCFFSEMQEAENWLDKAR